MKRIIATLGVLVALFSSAQAQTAPDLDYSLAWSLKQKERGSYTLLYTPLGNSALLGPLTLTGGVTGGTNNITATPVLGFGGAIEAKFSGNVVEVFGRLGGFVLMEQGYLTDLHATASAGLRFKTSQPVVAARPTYYSFKHGETSVNPAWLVRY